ncbi:MULTISPECIES: hypothetical protein [unclassified Rathayibacter]|uniref:hypothetical protein n=1 Tax=unclassified Rathayibacter TaxID=2609250 RepID=UPI001C612A94|nr:MULTISPECIES: hypothetical protein [unclassified Rathayibacter]
MASFIPQYKDVDPSERPTYFAQVEGIEAARNTSATAAATGQPVSIQITDLVAKPRAEVGTALTTVGNSISELEILRGAEPRHWLRSRQSCSNSRMPSSWASPGR